MAVLLADTVGARFVGPLAKTEIGDDQTIAAVRDRNVDRANVTVDVTVVMNVRQSIGQLTQPYQCGRCRTVVLGISSNAKNL